MAERDEEPDSRVSKFQLYVLRQIVMVLVVVAAGMFAVIWLTKSLSLIDLVMNRGLSVSMFAWITTLLLPASFAIVGPISLFVAAAYVYHRLTMDSELVIMHAAGISRLQLARPALLASAAMIAIGYLVSLYLMPLAYREYRDLKFQISHNYSSVLIQEGVFSQVVPGVTVYVRKRGPDGTLMGILVHDRRQPRRPRHRAGRARHAAAGRERPENGHDPGQPAGASRRSGHLAPSVRPLRTAVHHADQVGLRQMAEPARAVPARPVRSARSSRRPFPLSPVPGWRATTGLRRP